MRDGSGGSRDDPDQGRFVVSTHLKFSGILPANILPFTADYAIHEADYRRHLRWLADARGVTGIVCNGHAAEVSSLSREERREKLRLNLMALPGLMPYSATVLRQAAISM